ncbi:hypothetical protein Syun_013997 [Stephania yunnanensis]|uniref:Uncharacterized protein n=1 Tax=Stephania yunnanensis TaxID=152371 RepID=A0AAP0JIN4_9MAGN
MGGSGGRQLLVVRRNNGKTSDGRRGCGRQDWWEAQLKWSIGGRRSYGRCRLWRLDASIGWSGGRHGWFEAAKTGGK